MSTNWETADVLKTPMEICWQFDYAIGEDKLARLYSKAKKLQWDAETDMDWSYSIDPSKPLIDEEQFGLSSVPFVQSLPAKNQEALRAHIAAYQLSQFLHGEQGALMTAAALTHAVPDYEGKLYAATQTMDEARHVEVYDRYIKKLAVIYPMGHWLKALIDKTLTANHCDEARHVAFGGVYVGKTIAAMHPDQREDIAEFAMDVLKMMRSSRLRQGGQFDPGFLQVLVAADVDPMELVKGVAEARTQGIRVQPPSDQVHAFKHLMLPALVRVGAITDRTRALLEADGIEINDDRSVLESFEDRLEMPS